jgi:hypothetical protein
MPRRLPFTVIALFFQIDEHKPVTPLSAYAADKGACELHARVAGAVHRIPTLGLRIFNLYGPRQNPRSPDSGVITLFADRLTRGEPVEIFGDGEQVRDFVYVGDAVSALGRAISAASTCAPVFNVCTGKGRRCVPLPKSWPVSFRPTSWRIIDQHAPVTCEGQSATRISRPSSLASGPKPRWPRVSRSHWMYRPSPANPNRTS